MDKKLFFSISMSLLVFSILNIPSLKIVYSSELINISLVVLLWVIGVFRVISINKSEISMPIQIKKFLLAFISMWWVMLLVTLISNYETFTFEIFIRCIVAILYVVGVGIFIEYKDIKRILRLQVIWSFLLSITQITIGIKLNISLGQHYLTLGMPIAAGVISSLFLLFYVENNKLFKLFLSSSLLVSLLALTSLSGRSPVILAILVPVIFLLIIFIRENNFKNKMKMLLSILIFTPLFYYLIYNNISDKWLLRFQKLSNPEDEPRELIYKESIDIIQNNIWGTGINSSKIFGVYYPHNIFLEIAISGGIVSLVILLIILMQLISKVFLSTTIKSIAVCCGALSTFFFLTWNISFDLSTSYIPFVSMILLFSVSETNNRIIGIDEN